MYKAILFDLDGTLLPMNTQEFAAGYFRELSAKVLPVYPMDPKKFISAVLGGTEAMVSNNGRKTNRERFRETFSELSGIHDAALESLCDDFYAGELNNARCCTQDNPAALEAVRLAHEKAEKVILATNPLFPAAGQHTRLSWIGLKPEDFDFITDYSTDSYCKPNPKYFTSVCERAGVTGADCLMIGNDENEDMYAAGQAGIQSRYLVTDCLLPSREHPWTGPQGSFAEMVEMLRAL